MVFVFIIIRYGWSTCSPTRLWPGRTPETCPKSKPLPLKAPMRLIFISVKITCQSRKSYFKIRQTVREGNHRNSTKIVGCPCIRHILYFKDYTLSVNSFLINPRCSLTQHLFTSCSVVRFWATRSLITMYRYLLSFSSIILKTNEFYFIPIMLTKSFLLLLSHTKAYEVEPYKIIA